MNISTRRLRQHRMPGGTVLGRTLLGRTLLGGALATAVVVALAGCAGGGSATDAAGSIGAAGAAASAAALAGPVATATPTPTPTPTPTAKAPKVTHKVITKDVDIPFGSSTIDDPDRAEGETAVVTSGKNGTKTETWDVAFADGVETGRTMVSEATTLEPVTEVTAVGSKQPEPVAVAAPDPEPEAEGSGCDPNYSGACVPIDSDVDCAGGSGNGPSYVEGPVRVVGSDIYGLDRDGDGVGCE